VKKNRELVLPGIISAVLLAYTVYRSAHISFVYDESVTYLDFVKGSFRNVFAYPYLTANNHVLNTLLMKIVLLFGPPSDLLLRAPNLLAHVVFMISSWYLLAGKKDYLVRLCAFIFLNCNPYLIEFFSMARGYGLSLGFMMASLLFLKLFIQRFDNKWIFFQFLSLFCAGLSVLAGFMMTAYYAALGLVMLSWIFHRIFRHGASWKIFIYFIATGLLVSVPLFGYVVPKILQLNAAHQLYFGGTTGFWYDTVRPFFNLVLHYKPHPEILDYFFLILVIATAILPGIILGFLLLKNKLESLEKNYFFISIYLIMMTCVVISFVEHYLLKVPWLTERTALFLLLLFGLNAWFLLDYLYRSNRSMKWIALIFGAASVANMAASANTVGFLIFQDQTKNAMHHLEEDYHASHYTTVKTLNVIWVYAPTAEYYRQVNHDDWLKIDKTGKDSSADYFIVGENDIGDFKPGKYIVMKTFPVSGSVLMKKVEECGMPR
jgi:MFS family permease